MRTPTVLACAALSVLLLAALAAAPAPAQSDTFVVDLAEARRVGLESSPVVASARAALDAARGARRQAGGYAFNPQLEAKASSYLDPGDSGPFEGILTQELEWAGQWGLRKSAAGHRVVAAEAVLGDALRTTTLAIDVAYEEAVAAEGRHEVHRRGAELGARFLIAVTGQHREGKVSLLELNLSRIAAGRARAGERAARRDVAAARIELARVLGLPPDRAVRTDGSGPPSDPVGFGSAADVTERALSARPDLQAARAEADRAGALRALARREAVPNLRLAAVATRSTVGESMRWGLRVGLPIPLWNRNGGRAQEASAEERLAESRLAIVELAVRAEVAAALESYEAAREELDVYAREVLEPARHNADLLQRAFEEGEMDLPTALLLQTELLQAELGYWGAWAAERVTRARLEAVVGGG